MTKYGIIIYTEVVLIVKLITRKASSEARQRADRIIRDVHKLLGKEYRFFCRPIGSQTRRCIVQDKNGKYDLDYQIVLTENSKGKMDPTSIKKRFLWAFTTVKHDNERVEDSTTVVTVKELNIKRSTFYYLLKNNLISIPTTDTGRYAWNNEVVEQLKIVLSEPQATEKEMPEIKTTRINNRRYLGNKYKLLDFITSTV